MAREEFGAKESLCEKVFTEIGECYHLWTPENFEIIFTSEEDFKQGMSIVGISAKLFPDVSILTYELMSNHFHFTCAGSLGRILQMFDTVKKMLRKFADTRGRTIDWNGFVARTRLLESLADVRNVIIYVNRNGYVVSDRHTPYTYPWGANRYYFNPDACKLARENSEMMHIRELRSVSHGRYADGVKGLFKDDGCALPLSFCDVEKGEMLFRDAVHYFRMTTKNVELNAAIAKEIGENMYYIDDELFEIISKKCRLKYGEAIPSRLNPMEKTEVARMMRYEYNASSKQIMRILKLSPEILQSFGLK